LHGVVFAILCQSRPLHTAGDIGVERRPRRNHLEQPHCEVQARADHDVRRRKRLAENPRAFLQRVVEHVDDALCVAPAGGDRIHLDLGRDLHHRRLDAARAEEQPVEISCTQGIAKRRRQFRLGVTLGDIGADRGGFRQRGLAVLQGRNLAHRIDREIFDALLRAGGNVGQHALIGLPGFFHQPQ